MIGSFVLSNVHSTNAEELKSLVGGALLSILMLDRIGASTTVGRKTCRCHIYDNVAMQKYLHVANKSARDAR